MDQKAEVSHRARQTKKGAHEWGTFLRLQDEMLGMSGDELFES